MKTTVRTVPIVPLALGASLLTAALILLAPLSASAHDALVGSSPAADSTVDTLPSEITLTFSEKLITGEGATEVVVTDAAGASVTDGPATVDGAIVTQPLVTQAPAGVYHVVWKIVSSDGHPTSGEYSFAVTTSSLAPETTPPTTEPTATTTPDTTVTQAPQIADSSGDAVGIWVLVIIGVLIVAAVVIVVLSRRGNRGRTESDDSSER